MEYTLSKHATDAIQEREIKSSWIHETMTLPTVTEEDHDDPELQHVLRRIAEYDDRVLRVIFNKSKNPPHIVTVYFDRTMKGKL